MECLVDNPLYAVGPPDCYPCQNVQDIQKFYEPMQNFTDRYYNFGTPFVTKVGTSWANFYHENYHFTN